MNNILPLIFLAGKKKKGDARVTKLKAQDIKKSKSLHLHLKCLIVELMSLKIWLKYDRPLVNEISKDFSKKLEMTKIVVMFHD